MSELPLETDRLIIRNWQETDRELFFQINSIEQVMQFFSIRRSREQSEQLMETLHGSINEKGYGFTALALKHTDEAIGFCGLSDCTDDLVDFRSSVEIGWRLAPEHWGNGYATEAATRLLEFGFNELALEEIVSFAVPQNIRSIAVMKRIGMKRDATRDFDHPRVGEEHPDLKRHIVYSKKAQ